MFQERGKLEVEAIRMNHWEEEKGRREAEEGPPITKGPHARQGRGICSVHRERSEMLDKGRMNSDCLWWGSRAWTRSMMEGATPRLTGCATMRARNEEA